MKTSAIYNGKGLKALIFMLLLPLTGAMAQSFEYPLSGITTTASFYSYVHRTSDTTGIEIKYFIVMAPNGEIKSAFDACEVCWAEYKGYVQLSTYMRCVNCGNTYPINALGTQGSGGCWPGYLPHTTGPGSISIEASDLATGAWMFQEVPMDPPGTSSVFAIEPAPFDFHQHAGQLVVKMPTAAKRSFSIQNLNGQVLSSAETASSMLTVPTHGLRVGVYIFNVEENGQVYSRKFWVE